MPFSSLVILFAVCGVAAWFGLLLSSDSSVLRVVRLVAIAFLVQIASMLAGGAIASSLTEGHNTAGAVARMASLAWSERGDFLRAAVYTLPRWLGSALLSWGTIVAAVILPFLVAGHLLPLWLAFLGARGSPLLTAGRVPVLALGGLSLVVVWRWLLKRSSGIGLRVIWLLALAATVWAFAVLPFLPGNSLDGRGLWFLAVLDRMVAGGAISSLPGHAVTCLFLVSVVVLVNTAIMVGVWLFLYPLASGVCVFFSLRKQREGEDYRAASGTGQAAAPSLFTAPGSFLFRSGGASALASLSPPRGWLALAWVGYRPGVIVLSLVSVLCVAALTAIGSHIQPEWRHLFLSGGLLLTLGGFLPLASRALAPVLDSSTPKRALTAAAVLPFMCAGAWALSLLNIALLVACLALGGTLGVIPTVGPLIWGLAFPFLLLGASRTVVTLVRWAAGLMILPAVAANEIGPRGRASDALRQVGYYAEATPGSFLLALVAGLPFTLLPAVLVSGICALTLPHPLPTDLNWSRAFQYLFGKASYDASLRGPLIGMGCCLSLLFVGIAAAVTNAYLVVRQSPSARRFQVGDVVILGRHTPVNGDANWDPAMDRFVGSRTRITAFVGKDSSACDVVRVQVDGGQFVWRVINLSRPTV